VERICRGNGYMSQLRYCTLFTLVCPFSLRFFLVFNLSPFPDFQMNFHKRYKQFLFYFIFLHLLTSKNLSKFSNIYFLNLKYKNKISKVFGNIKRNFFCQKIKSWIQTLGLCNYIYIYIYIYFGNSNQGTSFLFKKFPSFI
jgi:hypothetical protein